MKAILTSLTLILALGAIVTPEFFYAQQQGSASEQESDRAQDPVCRLLVRKNPELSVRYGGETYYFCMKADMETFRKDPEKYLQGRDHTHPDPRG